MSAKWSSRISYLDREIGKAIRRMREARGLSVSDIEDKTGYSARHIRALEGGESIITPQHLLSLARVFDCEAEDIRRCAMGIEAEMKLPRGKS